jgi:tRNA-specific 2-thiouridylase
MKVFAAMSGGVDSAASAILLQDAGHRVEGVTLALTDLPEARAAVTDAAALCAQLGIPHHVMHAEDIFRDAVTGPFCAAYRAGRTPNPCVLCNRAVKFGALMDWALAHGGDALATGHYARVTADETGVFALRKAADPAKDQSYVLYSLTQADLARVLFPLGGMTKAEARAVTAARGLTVAQRPESQDICFVPDGDYPRFIADFTGHGDSPGDFVLPDGRVVGRHHGICAYTVGQRKGLGVAYEHPLYVLKKDAATNTITLGSREAALSRAMTVAAVHWIATPPDGPVRAAVRTRYHQRENPATVYPEGDTARVVFDDPVAAPAPGQTAVFYADDIVLGGGEIAE